MGQVIGRAVLLLVLCAAVSAQTPPAVAYPSRDHALKEPSAAESEALQRIQAERARRRLPPLAWDPILSRVAREHSEDMAARGYFDYVSPVLGTLEYRQHRAGSPAPNVRYGIYRCASADRLIRQIAAEDDPFRFGSSTHIGIGVAVTGLLREWTVTLITAEMHTVLESFPTQPLADRSYRLAFTLDQAYRDPRIITALPDGATVEETPRPAGPGAFEAIVAFNRGRGRYIVEIVATGPMGPAVLNLMHCYAGVEYPPPAVTGRSDGPPEDLGRAEREMLDLINRDRRAAGLKALVFDDALAAVARAHSDDMARGGFFAHISPARGDLDARITRAGLVARAFTENLAHNRSVAAAHEGLMNSPGHRRNILDPEAARVGIGIVRSGDGGILVTQNFARDFIAYDTAATARDLLESLNAARAKAGVARLTPDDALNRIALENSEAMRQAGRLTSDRALERLKALRLPYAVQIRINETSAPPRTEQVPQALEGKYRRIGLGVAQSPDGQRRLWTTLILAE